MFGFLKVTELISFPQFTEAVYSSVCFWVFQLFSREMWFLIDHLIPVNINLLLELCSVLQKSSYIVKYPHKLHCLLECVHIYLHVYAHIVFNFSYTSDTKHYSSSYQTFFFWFVPVEFGWNLSSKSMQVILKRFKRFKEFTWNGQGLSGTIFIFLLLKPDGFSIDLATKWQNSLIIFQKYAIHIQ